MNRRRDERLGPTVGGASIVLIVAISGLLLTGSLVALADTVAQLVGSGYQTGGWATPSGDPSGAAWIGPDDYLLVVDTNLNVPSMNGWEFDIGTGVATNRGSGVLEPSGLDYDPDSDTLFVSQDDGHIYVFTDFDSPGEQMIEITVPGFDTEDPAYNRNNDRLYWVDGAQDTLFEMTPVSGWGGGNEVYKSYDLSGLNESSNSDWEGLAWDPETGNLLIANTLGRLVYEVGFNGGEVATSSGEIFSHSTIVATGVANLTRISGMGISPASYDPTKQSLWVTDREANGLFELTFDGTMPPTTTTTTQPTSTTTGQGSTTSTTQGTTTTTVPGQSSTTVPGANTTTTTTGTTPPNPDPDLAFSDIAGSVFAGAIQWMAGAEITQGCNPPANTLFCPDARVTRGQMATFLVRAQSFPAYNGPDRFRDDDASVFEGAIERLAQAGITVGCNPPTNDRFCPDRNVTRGEMAAFLGRAFGYTDDGGGDWFVDDDGSVFEDAIDRLRTAGITQGCNPPSNSRYCPDDYVTRGQMAAFLKRALGA